MALYRPTYTDKKTRETRTSAVWWYKFIYCGKEIRESARTTRKMIAADKEKNRRLELEKSIWGHAAPETGTIVSDLSMTSLRPTSTDMSSTIEGRRSQLHSRRAASPRWDV